EYGPKWNK
nr:Chain B, Myb1 peptide [Trichomonas vaginalis]5YBA_D Chain D, Myb1 peptide [Trichomonas vaginalis]